jgi:hypothetical protein
MITDYYVYAYLDPSKKGTYSYESYTFDHEPFYIGKGKKGHRGRRGRCIRHLTKYCLEHDTNRLKVNKIIKIKEETGTDPIVLMVKEDMLNTEAIALEIKLIKEIGRRDKKAGPLSNLTDGGDTSTMSPEAILKLSLSKLGIKRTQEVKDKISKSLMGKKPTDQQRLKMSVNNVRYWKGKKLSKETIEKMKRSIHEGGNRVGIKNPNAMWVYTAKSPTGDIFNRIENINIFLKDNNVPICGATVRRLSSGRTKRSYSGWVFEREKI